jgi:glycerophosphoryl diester phosphodiesterase
MMVISHRGYHVDVPENTIAAFERALSMGVDGIETDVCLSVDGEAMLFHDRLTLDGRKVSTLSRGDLSTIVGYPIPNLSELERLIERSGKNILWNLEVKEPDALDQTLTLMNRQSDSARFLLSSFWHPTVLDAARRASVDCGLLVCHRPILFRDLPRWLLEHRNLRTVVWDYERLDAALVSEAAACGLRNFVYGVVTVNDHRDAAAWGVDGIITDRPEFASSLNSRGASDELARG